MYSVKIREALDGLDESLKETLAFFSRLDPSNITEMLKAFALLHDACGRLDDAKKTLDQLYDHYNYEVIPLAFGADQPTPTIKSINTAGKNFILSTRINASIPENMRNAGNAWVRDVAGIPELIVPRVNPKQLSSIVKAYFEANAEWPPENAIKVHQQNYIQVRKA